MGWADSDKTTEPSFEIAMLGAALARAVYANDQNEIIALRSAIRRAQRAADEKEKAR